jgi:hypothetical protein
MESTPQRVVVYGGTVFSAESLSTNQLCTPRRLRGVASAPGPLISSAVCTIVLLDVLPLRL